MNFCCMDCGYDTDEGGEWYMVKDEVWLQACGYIEGRLPGEGLGKQILCIGCLEKRIGRTLMRAGQPATGATPTSARAGGRLVGTKALRFDDEDRPGVAGTE